MHHMGLILVCACFCATNSLETDTLKKKKVSCETKSKYVLYLIVAVQKVCCPVLDARGR